MLKNNEKNKQSNASQMFRTFFCGKRELHLCMHACREGESEEGKHIHLVLGPRKYPRCRSASLLAPRVCKAPCSVVIAADALNELRFAITMLWEKRWVPVTQRV